MKFIYADWHEDVYIAIAYDIDNKNYKINLHVFAKSEARKKARIEIKVPIWYLTSNRFVKSSFGKYNIKNILFKATTVIDLELNKRGAGDYFAYIHYEIVPSKLSWLFIFQSISNPLLAVVNVINNIEIKKIEIYDYNDKLPSTSIIDNIYTGITETFSTIPKSISYALFIGIVIFIVYLLARLKK